MKNDEITSWCCCTLWFVILPSLFLGLSVYECKYNRDVPSAQVISPCFCYQQTIVCAAAQEANIVDWAWPCNTTLLEAFDIVMCDEQYYRITNLTHAQSSMLACASIRTRTTSGYCIIFSVFAGMFGAMYVFILLSLVYDMCHSPAHLPTTAQPHLLFPTLPPSVILNNEKQNDTASLKSVSDAGVEC